MKRQKTMKGKKKSGGWEGTRDKRLNKESDQPANLMKRGRGKKKKG